MEDVALIEASPEKHVMSHALITYVHQKTHPDLFRGTILDISVKGTLETLQRQPLSNDTQFNSRTPTVSFISPVKARLNCFPSKNLCFHYASIIATYWALKGQRLNVSLNLPTPTQTEQVFHRSNIQALGPVDIAIIGLVHHLDHLHEGDWESGPGEVEHDIFRWKKFTSPRGDTVALIGCLEKIWGDASYHLLHSIYTQSKIKCVIYIGKAGALSARYSPNEWIATGERAVVDNETIAWKSPLTASLHDARRVAYGPLVTVPTTLCETREWLEEWSPKADWVDCEVGYIAKAAAELKVAFGYLLIVSDNLQISSGEDLSNEESEVVVKKREKLYQCIIEILDSFISQ